MSTTRQPLCSREGVDAGMVPLPAEAGHLVTTVVGCTATATGHSPVVARTACTADRPGVCGGPLWAVFCQPAGHYRAGGGCGRKLWVVHPDGGGPGLQVRQGGVCVCVCGGGGKQQLCTGLWQESGESASALQPLDQPKCCCTAAAVEPVPLFRAFLEFAAACNHLLLTACTMDPDYCEMCVLIVFAAE